MYSTLRIPRNVLQNVLYKNALYKNPTYKKQNSNLCLSTFSRPYCSPSTTPGITNRLGSMLNSPRSFSVISKTRLRNRPFWFVVIGITAALAYIEYNSDPDSKKKEIDFMQNTNDLGELTTAWNGVYESLLYPLVWEKYLKAGIVQLGMYQLKELYDILPFGEARKRQLMKKAQKLREGTVEYMDTVNQVYLFDTTMKVVEKICHTLARLCESETVAEYIVAAGGLELISDFTMFGVDNFYLGELWNAILQHKTLNSTILEREGFIERLEALAAARDPPFAIRQVYNTLLPIMRDEAQREKILKDERIVKMVSEYNSFRDDGFHKFFSEIFQMPVSTWDTHTRAPKRQQVFEEPKDLRNDIARTVLFGAFAAVYCGVRWKRTLPNLANGILVRKMATAFVGVSSIDIVSNIYTFNTFSGPAGKEELNNYKMLADPQESKFYNLHRSIGNQLGYFSLLVFFVSYYNAKFVLFPAILETVQWFLVLPSKKDFKNGTYVKWIFED
eukprot:Phypoly_transcript_07619.p1 GENE.Phypoly_transcript_07619~~Phypoly_transcript_07619.p1  ORF type:complete len:502 (+),score=70.04 Phypoly_transcript_07619:97-1602(+)